MKIEQIYTGCLAQGAYYIESDGEVAIIDPLREVQPYIDKAEANNAHIKYIFETHFHADFVSGHVTLSKETGAPIIYGPNAKTSFNSMIAIDQQEFKLGEITIVALHTPGHTMESTTYLLRDENNKDHAIFSGDTLFLGDVGRPDLAQKSSDKTQDDLAGLLYDSLRTKIMTLPDDVLVYPAHGAGSACGKNLSSDKVGTIGNQKETNYALRGNLSKREFIQELAQDLTPAPVYFPFNVQLNQEGYDDINEIIKRSARPIHVRKFDVLRKENAAIVLDVRSEKEFSKGHIPNSIFVGIDGSFAPWVGSLIGNIKQPILLVTPKGREKETIIRLARVGFDNTIGYLKGGFQSWKLSEKKYDTVNSISANDFKDLLGYDPSVFDVRKKTEFSNERIKYSKNIPLAELNNSIDNFPVNKTFFLHCAGGYRSMIAASILKSKGIHNVIDVNGGIKAIKDVKIPTLNYVHPVQY